MVTKVFKISDRHLPTPMTSGGSICREAKVWMGLQIAEVYLFACCVLCGWVWPEGSESSWQSFHQHQKARTDSGKLLEAILLQVHLMKEK